MQERSPTTNSNHTMSIVEDYDSSLRELTFNSRPIIDNLTIIAKENPADASGILAVITNRIYKCIPEHKLFALYLLDSICKIVGEPYTTLVGPEIFKLFSHVYLLVNDATRAKLVKIYELWRVTKTKGMGAPLFAPEELARIGTFLTQAGYRRPEPSVPVAQPPAISAQLLVADIDALMPALQLRSNVDSSMAGKLAALAQLRALLLSQTLAMSDLLGIQEKLQGMKRQELPLVSVGSASVSAVENGNGTLLLGDSNGHVAPPSRAAALFDNLVASGLVKVDQSLKPGLRPEYELQLPKHKYSPGQNGGVSANALEQLLHDVNFGSKSQYEQIKTKELVKVAQRLHSEGSFAANIQAFITQSTLEALTVQVLYETKLLKCAQCGKRFTADDAGAAKKRVHLDWHFRINKKLANFKTNIQSRNWYLDDIAWVHFRDDDLLEYENPAAAKPKVAAVAEQPKQASVVIPSTETDMNNMCIICQEQVNATYSDSLGEWVWDKCILAPGQNLGRKIVHVACHEEASRKRGPESDAAGAVKRERLY